MRRGLLLGVVVLAVVTGCGSGSADHTPIVFGISGGNMVPYRVSIQPNGTVRVRGSHDVPRGQISPDRVRQLRHEIAGADLSSSNCTGTLPDVASRYVRLGGRTYTVHGDCEAPFNRVWNDLSGAVGLSRS